MTINLLRGTPRERDTHELIIFSHSVAQIYLAPHKSNNILFSVYKSGVSKRKSHFTCLVSYLLVHSNLESWKPSGHTRTVVRQHRPSRLNITEWRTSPVRGITGEMFSLALEKRAPLVLRSVLRVKRCKVYTTTSSSVRFLILGRAPSFRTAHR